MVSSNIEVEGLGQLQKDLSGIKDKLTKKELQAILRPGIKVMQRAIKQRVPVRKGALKRAIRVKAGKGRANAPYASMWTTLGKTYMWKGKKEKPFYAIMVHNGVLAYGTKNNKRKKRVNYNHKRFDGFSKLQIALDKESRASGYRVKPNPFVAEAFDENVQRVADMILTNIADRL